MFKKVIALTLSFALLLTAAFGTTVFAADDYENDAYDAVDELYDAPAYDNGEAAEDDYDEDENNEENDEDEQADEETAEADEATDAAPSVSAYDLLEAANQALMDAGSVAMRTDVTGTMTAPGMPVISFTQTMDISQVIRSEFDFDMRMDMTMSINIPGAAGVGTPVISLALDNPDMLPLRAVAEALGAQVEWNGETRTAIVNKGGAVVLEVPIDEPFRGVDLLIVEGRTYVPASYLLSALSASSEWDSETLTVFAAAGTAPVNEVTRVVSYFRDGTMYMNVAGDWISMPLPLEDIADQIGITTFPEAAVASQDVQGAADGYIIMMVISGEALGGIMDNIMSGLIGTDLPGDVDVNFGDITLNSFINADGYLENMDMQMNMTMNMDGEIITLSADMRTAVTQVGGVTIDFPEDMQ